MKKYALVWCSDKAAMDYRERMVDEFRQPDEVWEILTPADPDLVDKAAEYDGFVISGSEKSVVDDGGTPPVARLLSFLQAVEANSDAPVLGICFGAQALAAALGGAVGKNPDRRFRLGVESLDWTAQAGDLPEVRNAPSCTVVQSHGECVTRLPEGSTLLAGSATIPHEVFLVRERFLAVQGHPEIDSTMLRDYFMPLHRRMFDDDDWQQVLRESALAVDRAPLLALARRLLGQGRL
jgi:GMP synthase (glutamine-hydrolysing)